MSTWMQRRSVTVLCVLSPTSVVVQRKCRKIADPFVEFEAVLLFIDMMLHKVSVYRHLLINRTPHSQYRQTGGGLPVSLRIGSWVTALRVWCCNFVRPIPHAPVCHPPHCFAKSPSFTLAA